MNRGHSFRDLDDQWFRELRKHPAEPLPLEGVYHPHLAGNALGIAIPQEWLGQTCVTRIAGLRGEVTLPRLDVAREGAGLLAPPVFRTLDSSYDWSDWTFPSLHPGKWGEHSRQDRLCHVRDFRVAVEPGNTSPLQASRQVQEAIGAWWDRVKAWIEVLSSQDLEGPDRFHWSSGKMSLWTETVDGTPRTYPGQSWFRRTWRPSMGFGFTHFWAVGVYWAGCELDPPLEWVMLREALRALETGQYRRTVMECGIAAELALTRRLKSLHRLPLPRTAKGKQPPEPMLGALVRMESESANSVLPPDFISSVVGQRNDVMHRGRRPTEDEAMLAFDRTIALVSSVSPRDDLTEGGLIVRTDPPRGVDA